MHWRGKSQNTGFLVLFPLLIFKPLLYPCFYLQNTDVETFSHVNMMLTAFAGPLASGSCGTALWFAQVSCHPHCLPWWPCHSSAASYPCLLCSCWCSSSLELWCHLSPSSCFLIPRPEVIGVNKSLNQRKPNKAQEKAPKKRSDDFLQHSNDLKDKAPGRQTENEWNERELMESWRGV